MTPVDTLTTPQTTTRTKLYGWAIFLLVVIAATWFFGPVALMVLSVVAGGALIFTGIRSQGWPRWLLIVVGAILVIAPILFLADVLTGAWVVSVK